MGAVDIFSVMAVSFGTAIISEIISWLLIYRTDSYKKLNEEIEKTTKRLESQTQATNKSKKKKADRCEEILKQRQQELQAVKLKSTFAIVITMAVAMGLASSYFDGKIVAILPFEPVSLIRNISHRNILGQNFYECNFFFLYLVGSWSIRPLVQRCFGTLPPRSSNKGLLEPPS